MKLDKIVLETLQTISIGGILYTLNTDEKSLYTKIKNEKKIYKKDLDEFTLRIANDMVSKGILTRKKDRQSNIYFTTRGRRKIIGKSPLDEIAPPDKSIEKWIVSNKDKFKERYGKDYGKYLYGKAWNKFNGKKIDESYYIKRQSEFGNTGVMFNDDYIDFQPGMKFVDEDGNVWEVESRAKLRAEYNPPLTIIDEKGNRENTTLDDLNIDVFQLEKYKMIFDPKFFDENDGLEETLNESLLDVRQKNAKNLSDEDFKKLLSYDPLLNNITELSDEILSKSNESYSRWLLKMNKLGELNKTTPEKLRQYLKAFNQAKLRKNLLPNNDINSYKSIEDLKNALSTVKDNLTANQKNKDAKKASKQLSGDKEPGMYMDGAVELLFSGKNWEVWTPHTFEGSKALRRGADWCTGADNCIYYDNYVADGTLYVIINKENPKEKLQLFVPTEKGKRSREFRDAHNESVKFRNFVYKNNELLGFFLTQDDVSNAYPNLDDPEIDDEWDEEREEDVMIQYGLSYNYNSGEVQMDINYYDLVKDWYYTSPEDYQEYASTGEINELHSPNINEWYKKVVMNKSFADEIEWEKTDLDVLYKFYMKQTGNKINFNKFLYTLFNTKNGEYNDKKIEEWLQQQIGDGYDCLDSIIDSISKTYLNDPVIDFVRESLIELGWEEFSNIDNNLNYHIKQYEEYLESFKNNFPFIIKDCHNIEDFYNNYTDYGQRSYSEVLQSFNIGIGEKPNDISTNNIDYKDYSEEEAEDSAHEIINLFMSNDEWNNFINEYNVNEDKSDDEIDEVLKITKGIRL